MCWWVQKVVPNVCIDYKDYERPLLNVYLFESNLIVSNYQIYF